MASIASGAVAMPGSAATPEIHSDTTVKWFILGAVGYFAIVGIIALIIAAKFVWPEFLGSISYFTYGRMRPLHVNGMLFGWLLAADIGLAYCLVPRLCGVKLWSEKLGRQQPPVAKASARAISLEIVEDTFPEQVARALASRCLRCNVNTVFDTGICVARTGCVDVCPENLIRLTSLEELRRTGEGRDWVADALGISPAELDAYDQADLDAIGGVMLKDEAKCIRCGLCASRCPSHAITMQRFDFHRICVSAPERNPQMKYKSAAGNGRPTTMRAGQAKP